MTILLRSQAGAAETAAGALRRVVAEIDPLVPVTRVRTMDEVVAASTSDSRSLTLLLLGFGFLAVSVGAVGVYSLIAYTVSWRTREIGIRLALGARRRDVVMMIVRQSFLLALGGSVAGLFVAAVSGRLLKQFLFEVSPLDPVTFLTCAFADDAARAAGGVGAGAAGGVDRSDEGAEDGVGARFRTARPSTSDAGRTPLRMTDLF